MPKLKGDSIISEKTKAIYPKVNDRFDEYNGKKSFVVNATFSPKFEKELLTTLEGLLEQAKNSGEWKDSKGKPYKWLTEPKLGYRVNEDTGEKVFRFHTNTTYLDKSGVEQEKKVPLRDVFANPTDVSFGHGSIVKIKFTPEVFWANATSNGVTLYLDAVQIIELKQFNGAGGDLGFGCEDDGQDINTPYEG